jgi:hypothetical protein
MPVIGVFALVAYLSLFNRNFERIADDPGLGWHLANGSIIAETGSVPRIDPFLASPRIPNPYLGVGESRPWINEQWLGDLILFELLSLGGWPLVYGVVAGLYLIAYFGVAADAYRRPGEGWLIVLLGIVLAFKLGQVHLIVRPVLFSIVLFSIFVARCRALLSREEWSWRSVLTESIVMGAVAALWANVHPAFIYGFLALGLAIVSLCLSGPGGPARGAKAGLILVACVFASALNPFGFGLYESMYSLGRSPALRGLTAEWSPVDFTSSEGRFLLLLAFIPGVCALASSTARRGVRLFDLVLAAVFVIQAAWAVRIVPFASLACLPLWAASFGGKKLIPERASTVLTRRVLQRLDERESLFRAPGMKSCALISAVGIVLMLLVPDRVLPHALGSSYERRLSELFAPLPVGQERVILASPDWGGAITHVMWPHSRAILDDRTVVVGEVLYRAYRESVREPVVFEELSHTFGVTDVLVPRDSALASYLASVADWRRVSDSEGTLLFTRR